MSTFRKAKNKDNPFVMIDKVWVCNPGLSAKAKGILLYLLSKPDDWVVYETDICNHMLDGIKSIRSGVKELIGVGHLHRNQVRDSKGRFLGYEHIVYENPHQSSLFTEVPFSENGKGHTTKKERTKKHHRSEVFEMTADEKHCREDDEQAKKYLNKKG